MNRERPTLRTVAGRAYLDLQNLARRQTRPTDELQQLYALEGFLARVAASAYAERFVLKGGVLLAAYGARRPTRDVDMQGREISNRIEDILEVVRDITAVHLDDGLVFDPAHAKAETIRDEDEYSGVRVTLTATLAAARLSLHVDINVGDPIWLAPRTVALPRLLGGTIQRSDYPLPVTYAEKIVTALHRGTANTRWRDFADLFLLSGQHPVSGDEVEQALAAVADYRQVDLMPLTDVLHGYALLAQARWEAWRRRQRLDDRLPGSFTEILATVITFADPALRREITEQDWEPGARAWL